MRTNTFYNGDCLFVLKHDIESDSIDLIYLDPPFFTGKKQETSKSRLLFGWNTIEPEKSKTFLRFLRDYLGIDWEDIKITIERSNDNKMMTFFGERKDEYVSIVLDKNSRNAHLMTYDGKSTLLDVKMSDSDLSIYRKSNWNPGVMEISYEDSKKFWGSTEKEKSMRSKAPEWIKYIATKEPALASYLYYMMERLRECHRVLKPTGSIYLHCDCRASHYLRMIMDEIFGRENFQNEIIWRIGWVSGYKTRKRGWIRNHETILYYSKTSDKKFNKEYIPYPEDYVRRDGKKPTGKGIPIEDTWNCSSADVLDSIMIKSFSKEKVGYPTQKPEKLLDRIILASSDPGDIVLDPFCGCGTAVISAHKNGRKWIGIDINRISFDIILKRCGQLNFDDLQEPKIIERTIEDVSKLTPSEFEKWVNEYYNAKKPKPDKGVDGIDPDGIPIQTKTHLVNYNVVSQFVIDSRHHPLVPKPVETIRIVSQKGFTDSARQRKYEIERDENIHIELVSIHDLLNMYNEL